jgi:hypothetical protein
MFDNMKRKANRIALRACVVIIACFVVEHGAIAYGIHSGLIQGHVVPPQISFGGYDAEKEQQIAMLGDALPAVAMRPIPDKLPATVVKADPVPAHKPMQVKAVR